MINIGIIGKGYIGQNIKFFNQSQKKKVGIYFFSTSKYFSKKSDYITRLKILKKNKIKIKKNFLNFVSKCDLIINTFTIQYDEFSKYDNHKRKDIFNFFETYINILFKEIKNRQTTYIHLSTNKVISNFNKSDANYWYIKCHNLIKKSNPNIKYIFIPNVFGFIKEVKKGKNLLINSIIHKSLKGKKFKFLNKNNFFRDILFIDDLCKILLTDCIIKINNRKIKYEITKAQKLIDKNSLKIEVHEFSKIAFKILNIIKKPELNYFIKKLPNNSVNKKIISILKNIRLKKFT